MMPGPLTPTTRKRRNPCPSTLVTMRFFLFGLTHCASNGVVKHLQGFSGSDKQGLTASSVSS